MNERGEAAKPYLLAGMITFAGGLVGSVFIKHASVLFASVTKWVGIGLGGLLLIIGVYKLIGGKSLLKVGARVPDKPFEDQLHDMQMKTLIKQEEAKQKQMDNIIAMQQARIQALKSRTGPSDNNMMERLGGFVRGDQKQQKSNKYFKHATDITRDDILGRLSGLSVRRRRR